MIHLDLFSGIGGFAYAVDSVFDNVEHIFCEIDPFCQQVLKKHWKDSVIHGDIRKVTANTTNARTKGLREWENKVFLLTGGFPCQPFSQAGKQKGVADNRHLWPEMLRVIHDFKPAWVVAENVRGLLTIEGGLVFEQVCVDLEAEGYEVQPFIIPAVAVNAPHRRDRVWIVANTRHGDGQGATFNREIERPISCKEDAPESKRPERDAGKEPISDTASERCDVGVGDRQERQVLPSKIGENEKDKSERSRRLNRISEGDSLCGFRTCEPERPNEPRAGIAEQVGYTRTASDASNTPTEGLERQCGGEQRNTQCARHNSRTHWNENWLEVATELCGVDDGLPAELDGFKLTKAKHRVERLKSLGNSIVPQVAIEIFKAIKATGSLNPQIEESSMSIEQELNRIANCLEELSGRKQEAAANVERVETPKKKKAEPEFDPLAEESPAQPVVEKISIDRVREALRTFMQKKGAEKTKSLMIKFGADKDKPVVTSIPEKNYAGILEELEK